MSNDLFTTIRVEGMTCNHCKANVENNISSIEGIDSAEVNLSDGSVNIKGEVNLFKIEQVVNSLGYKYKGEK